MSGSMNLPENYATARKALAEVRRIDQVKTIHDKAVALKVYAYQAKDPQLAGDSLEIIKRAVRRMGELMAQMQKAKGTRGHLSGKDSSGGVKKTPPEKTVPTLDDAGVDKELAKRARRSAAMSEEAFEADIAKGRALAVAAAEGNKAVITAARLESHLDKKARRETRERTLAAKIAALPTKKYAVILADPEWKFEFWSEKGKTNSSADNHYLTSELEVIKARDVPSISADDCVLFLWATAPMTPHALEVMKAWGFSYVSQWCWGKSKAGTGYWARNKHELLLIGTKGKIPAPAPGDQPESLIIADVGKHSQKPLIFYELIERLFPTVPKIELNQRIARAGWDGWGNEAPAAEAAE